MSEARKRTTRTIVAFGDVVQLSKERSQDPEAEGFERYIGLEHLETNDLKVRNWGDIADGTTFTSVFRPGQVLFGKRRAYQRKVAIADFSGVCSGDIYVLEPKNDHLLPELLPFICQSEPFYDYVISMSQGGLSPRVNWKALAKYEFPLPPLDEQRRIAEVLQAIEGLKHKLIAVFDALEMLEMARGVKILSYDSCALLPVSDIARFRSGDGIRVSELAKVPTSEVRVPVYGGNGIAGYTAVAMKSVPVPTIVIGRVGEYCGTVHSASDPSWVSDNALYMSEVVRSCEVGYLALCLKAARLNRLKSGGAQPLINQKIVGCVHIPFPSLQFQKALVREQDSLDASRQTLTRRLEDLQRLANGLLSTLEEVS